MPVMINQGMSCLIANKNVSLINKNKVGSLFSKIGNYSRHKSTGYIRINYSLKIIGLNTLDGFI